MFVSLLVVAGSANALQVVPCRSHRVINRHERHLVVNIISRLREMSRALRRVVHFAQRMLSAVHLADSLPFTAVPALLLGASVLVASPVSVSCGSLRHYSESNLHINHAASDGTTHINVSRLTAKSSLFFISHSA